MRIGAPPESTSLITREIAPSERVMVAAPAYLEAYGEPAQVGDLKNHRCLHYGYLASGSRWRLAVGGVTQSVAINCVMWSNNGEVLRDAAVQGQGIALLPTFVCGPPLRDGVLKPVLSDHAPQSIALCALYPRHRHLSAKVQLFLDHLSVKFEQSQYW